MRSPKVGGDAVHARGSPCLPVNMVDTGRIVIWSTPSQRKGCRPASQSFREIVISQPILVILVQLSYPSFFTGAEIPKL